MSEAAPIDPRRARLQPQPDSDAQAPLDANSTAPGEELDTVPQLPETAEAVTEDAAVQEIAPDQTTAVAPASEVETPADPVVESEMELEKPAEDAAVPHPESLEAPAASSPSGLDAAISATLADADSEPPTEPTIIAAPEPPRDSAGTPALYEADPSSTEVPKIDTPTVVAPSKPAATKPTSSLSRVAQLTQRVEKNPLDGEAQLALLQEVEAKGDLERTREVYEKFLNTFPDASQQWISYCDLELQHGNFSEVESIFSRCLRISTSVDLWRFYLDYIRRINPIDSNNQEAAKQTRSIIANAFEFALAHIGQDRRAGDVWVDLINFLREGSTRGTWEEQQKMDALRKAFQRAVQVPLNNVEQIWQDYNAFENGLSKMTAKKFIAELSPSYMTARKCLRELRAQHDALYTPLLPHPPDWNSTQSTVALEGWKRYLAFEESNPLEIDDIGTVMNRVSFAYRKALACLRFYAEVWYLSANYNLRMGRTDEAKGQLQAGLTAIPSSLLLAYTLADIEESNQDHPACYAIYDNLIAHLYGKIAQLESTVADETAAAIEELDADNIEPKQEENGTGDEDMDEGGAVEKREKRAEEEEQKRKEVKDKYEPELEKLKKMVSSVWITEMRFARRADGVKPARQVFTKARKSPHLSWQVIEASATMEMYWNEEPKVATNVFELGLKLFSKEPEYVLRYLDFLLQQNNANNARALFERTVALIEPLKAKPIWDRMAQYEYEYGDHLATQKMFLRYAEVFFQIPSPIRFASKFAYPGLEDSFIQDLGPSVSVLSRAARGRSPSPRRGRAKRGLSPSEGEGEVANRGTDDGDNKRPRIEASPAPSNQAGGPNVGGSGPVGRPNGGGPRGPPEPAPALNRAAPFMLDPRGDNIAVLPDAVVFFLGLLPPAAAFTGPQLNPVTIMDIITNTILPGSAPGPGLPGERLGVPPRAKREPFGGGAPNAGYGGPPQAGGGGYGGDIDRNGGGGGGHRTGYGGGPRRPLSPQRAPGAGGQPVGGGGGGYGRRY
ncbi:cleavage polyadenylation factor subunit RNA14 [Sporobolomyces koalae]|uniref:cleavage polyadenylation factor subunit RNA14 n=1 Tax=Sporobolomyces koalae TaxID=500713 RepID=UPI003181EAA6